MANRVARYQADRTNQKFYFSRIYCQLAEETPQAQLQTAHVESAILHLYGGYLAFLQEISHYYHVNLAEPSLTNIEKALAERTQISPEIVRLKKLLQVDFLADIEQAVKQVNFKPVPKEKTENNEKVVLNGKLPVVDVMAKATTDGLVISVDMVRQWRGQLLEVVESLREGMVEF